MGGRRGENQKGSDFSAIPLCREHHREIETIGVTLFEEKYRMKVWKVAWAFVLNYWRTYG
jgi:hypothetical protein